MKLKYDRLLSNFAFNCNLRHYKKAKLKAKTDKPWYDTIVSPILLQAFTLTFLAEWGDRSQIATIAMGADYNAWGGAQYLIHHVLDPRFLS